MSDKLHKAIMTRSQILSKFMKKGISKINVFIV